MSNFQSVNEAELRLACGGVKRARMSGDRLFQPHLPAHDPHSCGLCEGREQPFRVPHALCLLEHRLPALSTSWLRGHLRHSATQSSTQHVQSSFLRFEEAQLTHWFPRNNIALLAGVEKSDLVQHTLSAESTPSAIQLCSLASTPHRYEFGPERTIALCAPRYSLGMCQVSASKVSGYTGIDICVALYQKSCGSNIEIHMK